MTTPWTNEKTAELKHLWSLGKSFEHISDALGVTIGSVAGKVKRLQEKSEIDTRRAQLTGRANHAQSFQPSLPRDIFKEPKPKIFKM